MADKDKTNKILTIVLAIVICLAAVVIIYVNLPQETTDYTQDETNDGNTTDDDETEEPVTLLTVMYNNTKNEYTLEELESFSAVTGTGRQVKSKLLPDTIQITPDLNESAWEFVGVAVSTLLEEFEDLPDNYNITVTASDDWTSEYTKDNVAGVVNVYNETGIIGTSGATMILAYKQDGEYISDDYGPLRITFVGSDAITESSLWAKFVVSIEIVEV